jgi:hypothetical protein
MEGPCYGNGEDYGRERLEKHEREMWSWVKKYESGEEVDQEELEAWFLRPRSKEWVGLGDNYCPPKIEAAIIYKAGAHKKTLFELLAQFKSP